MNDSDDKPAGRNSLACATIPRALREEFDGIAPIKPRRRYETPADRSEHARQASLVRWRKFREQDEAKAGPRHDEQE